MIDNLILFGMSSVWLKPLWKVGAGVAIAVAALMLLNVFLRFVLPKVAAVASATAKESLSQPLFYILLAFGAFGLILFPFIPYNTLGEDIKMVKEDGLTLIMVLSIFLALWTASVSVAEEIEGRTALTLLSKPVGRREFIFGKFLGVLTPVVIMFIVLGAIFLSSVSYKAVYESRETGNTEPGQEECWQEIKQISPGLGLALMETVVLTAISVAISTRLSMMPNLIICATIYVLGNLVPSLLNSAIGQHVYVRFIAQLQSAVLPVFDHFNIAAVISTGQKVTGEYFAWAGIYCILYSTAAMLLALLLFEDRDLA